MLSRRAGVLFTVAVVAAPSLARAQANGNGVSVSLSVDSCVDVDSKEVRRLFELELGTSVPDAVQSDSPDATRVEVRCDGEFVELRIHDPLTGKSLTRRIELGDRGRERLLALAVMELLVASWVELATTPEPVVPAVDKRAAASARRGAEAIVSRRLPPPEPVPERRWRTTTSVFGAATVSSPGVHGGGGIRVVFDGPSGFGWGADLVVQKTTDELELGTVSVNAIEGGLSAHAHWGWRPLRVRAALGARIGAATLSGDPSSAGVVGNSVTGLAGGPFGRLTAGVELAGHVAIELSAEPGYNLFPVRGSVDGAERTAIEGAWVTGQLGVGWMW